MSWTPWIETEGDDTSNAAARQLYERTRNPATKQVSDLTRITSLTPPTSELIDRLCASVYTQATGVSPREKEIASVIVSSLNGCVH